VAVFTILARRQNGEMVGLTYNNLTSDLRWRETGERVVAPVERNWPAATIVSPEAPGRKETVTTLKISLGLSCNYSCTYCSQRFVPHAAETAHRDIEPFLTGLDSWFDTRGTDGRGRGLKIEFWGGEPLVYWKTLKPLAEALRERMPNASFLMVTNGSLLDEEKNSWIDRMGFQIGLSHDGPGQKVRGPDPFDDAEKARSIYDLYARLKPSGRITINPMLHRTNPSRAAIQTWFQARFGDEVVLGEGGFIDPYDEGGMAYSLKRADHLAFRQTAFRELREGRADRFEIASMKIGAFVNTLTYRRPGEAVWQKCGMDRPTNIAVTLRGDVITCQNTSPAGKAPNGKSHKIGTVADLAGVKLDTARHWSTRKECAACPVLQLCQGSCMFLEGKLWDAACDNAFSDNIVFFAAAIEFLTGAVPYYITAPLRQERRWIFGDTVSEGEQTALAV